MICDATRAKRTNSICHFAWLDLEAEEKKPLPCPFCGGETEANNCVGGWCVQCDCGYVSKQFNEGNDDEVLKAEAIAAHNRVAKMCDRSSLMSKVGHAVSEFERKHDTDKDELSIVTETDDDEDSLVIRVFGGKK